MLEKDKSPKKQEPTPKPTPVAKSSNKVNFGEVRHGPHLKKIILKMDEEELKAYGKQIGIDFNGSKGEFVWAAIAKYNSQQ